MTTNQLQASRPSPKCPSCGPVTIRRFHGVAITGLVRRPTTFAWRDGLTLEEAIQTAGGLASQAARAILIRLGSDPAMIALADSMSVRLFPGDNVFVEAV